MKIFDEKERKVIMLKVVKSKDETCVFHIPRRDIGCSGFENNQNGSINRQEIRIEPGFILIHSKYLQLFHMEQKFAL